jgi:hypothetical protein
MRKVKLVLEHLSVESFEISTPRGRGTVLGRMPDLDIRPNLGVLTAGLYLDAGSPRCEDTPLASCDGCGGATDTIPLTVTG